MNYEEIMSSIFDSYSNSEHEDTCGEESKEVLRFIKQNSTAKEYIKLESTAIGAFCENEMNGFYNGFRCAIALLTGGKEVAV